MRDAQILHELKIIHERVDTNLKADASLVQLEYESRVRVRAYENIIHRHPILGKLIKLDDVEAEITRIDKAEPEIKNNIIKARQKDAERLMSQQIAALKLEKEQSLKGNIRGLSGVRVELLKAGEKVRLANTTSEANGDWSFGIQESGDYDVVFKNKNVTKKDNISGMSHINIAEKAEAA